MTARHAVFRADASPSIGTGHVIRCRTLASALVARGWTATLATRALPDGLSSSLRRAGVGMLVLDAAMPLAADPDRIAAGTDRPIALLVADHYGIDAAWLAAMRAHASVTMAIDDLADRPQPVDLLLNQNLGVDATRYDALVPADARVLIGPRFALVRPEFAELRARPRARDGRVERVIVFIGGADEADLTSLAVDALIDLDLPGDVVVGSAYGPLDALRARLDIHPALRLHVNVDAMADLMDGADLAIGSPGSASWERCTVGLPTVLVAIADNQRVVERGLVEVGAAVSLGWHASVTAAMVTDTLRTLIADPVRVAAMSHAAAAVTDGHGSDRVIAAIEELLEPTSVSAR